MTEERSASRPEAQQRIEDLERLFEGNDTMSLAACDDGKPWIGKVFFVDDEPAQGKLDLCCAILATTHNVEIFADGATVAFLVGGEDPERWVQGSGTAEVVADDADAEAVAKRVREKSASGARFLEKLNARAVRVHVQRLRVVDLDSDPPIAELTFS